MWVFSPVVEVAAPAVLDVGQDLALRNALAPEAVRDDAPWLVLQPAEQPPEEALGCG